MAELKLYHASIAVDRIRIANERAMQENIRQFLQGLK
jgi:hypothetical protein